MGKRLTAYFSGRVQGVGFRYTTERLAVRFPITGFVRNLADGRVEIVAEGKKEDLESLLKSIQASSISGCIHDREVMWSDADGSFQGFSVRY